jgi:hypothetical protein
MAGTRATESHYRSTPQNVWRKLRESDDETVGTATAGALLLATDLVLDAFDLDARSGAVDLYNLFGDGFSSLMLNFIGDKFSSAEPVDADTFSYTVLGWANGPKVGNPPHWICQSTAINDCLLGLMTTEIFPDGSALTSGVKGFYAQTLTVANNWVGGTDVFDSAGADRMSLLRIRDLVGIRYLEVLIHGCNGLSQAGEAPAIAVFGRAY